MVRITRTARQRGVRLRVRVSPHPDFPPHARALSGRHTRSSERHEWWDFDARHEDRVRQLCMDIWGTDGSWETDRDLVTVRWRIDWSPWKDRQELWLAGRFIARRYARDSPVQLGWGVVVAEGGFHSSGGSKKNPRVSPRDNTVLEIRDVPRAAALAETKAPNRWEAKDVVVVETGRPTPSTEELRQRRSELLHELATLNTLLDETAAAPTAPLRCRCGRHECPPEGYSIAEVARLAGCSRSTVTTWCRKGILPAVRTGRTGRTWTILPPLPERLGRTTIAPAPDTCDSED